MTDAAVARLQLLWSGFVSPGIGTVLTDPDRLYRTIIHSGYIERVSREDGGQAINLALLESMPLIAPLLASPIVAYRLLRGESRNAWPSS